jgi:hypothetical protein
MAIQGSENACTESMERAKFNLEHPPVPEAITIMKQREVDLMPGEDKEPIGMEISTYKEITGIESHRSSVIVGDVAIEEKRLSPPLEEHPDGCKSTE